MRTGHLARKFLCSALPGLLLAAQLVPPAQAAQVAIATAPLYITTTSLVKPNVLFIIDDSSSMDYNYLPDDVPWDITSLGNPDPQTDTHAVALTSSQCNGVAYNPGVVYSPPVKADGTSYASYTLTTAKGNGFDLASPVTNLTSHFYWIYDPAKGGTQTPLSYTYSNGVVDTSTTFYQECNTPATPPQRFTKKLVNALPATGPGSQQNYANWYSYYRTRLLMMKTLTGQAFQPLTSALRIGFSTLHDTGVDDSATFLPIDDFTTGVGSQKEKLFTKLYAISVSASQIPQQYTPARGALSKAGRLFAGKYFSGPPFPGATAAEKLRDPMQYSCQQNFALLASDGYWNSTDDKGDPSNAATNFGPFALDNMTMVGNMDGLGTLPPMFEGNYPNGLPVPNTLADVAMYYYQTDLRKTDDPNNCKSGVTGANLCPLDSNGQYAPNVPVTATDDNSKPHMTTFTVGLAINGLLGYSASYATDTTGDFNEIKKGNLNWPDARTTTVFPFADTKKQVIERVDDLWHTAVNGRGTYFNAKDPPTLVTALKGALGGVAKRLGFGSAGATSSLAPTAGNNSLYVASYTTGEWTGNLVRQTINPATGEVNPLDGTGWCVEDVLSASCIGKLETQASRTTDARLIYFNNGTTVLGNFKFSGANSLTATLKTHFDSTKQASLSQYGSWSASDKAAATGDALVDYLRGQIQYESQAGSTANLYRKRLAKLGDIVDTQPVFVGKPFYLFADPGYTAWKTATAQQNRAKTVFVSANDGMLHAFDAETGLERWAFVPTAVMPKMYWLADAAYANNHHNYVNGRLVWSDVCFDNCTDAATADWHTVLMGGLNGGGRGYYALDVTNPANPTMLWEFSWADDNDHRDIGYSFGNPLAVKKADGTWVVLVASGYDNGTKDSDGSNYAVAGSGKGVLYVLNPKTGAVITKYQTTAGDPTTPSGLARMAYWADSPEQNATALYAYGGDLLGNLWRFDINTTDASKKVIKLATFKDANGLPQPVTTRPEMTTVGLNRMIYIATGKYLEISDLTDRQTQSLYAIVDDGTTVADPRALAQRTLVDDIVNKKRTLTKDNKDPALGWFVDFPDVAAGIGGSERNNVDMILAVGTLVVPTNVPTQEICDAGGYSWLNFLNYATGETVGGTDTSTAGILFNNDLTSGINAVWIGRTPQILRTGTSTGVSAPQGIAYAGVTSGVQGHRVGWREIFTK